MALVQRILMSVLACIAMILPAVSTCAAGDDVLWPQRPVRIDRSKQNYERLPSLQGSTDERVWLNVPDRITVIDSTSFSFDGKAYRIGNVHPISIKRICGDRIDGRWTCGRMASVLLGNLVRNKRLLCDIVAGATETILNRCQSGAQDVASEIIAGGFGRADGDSGLKTTEDLARTKQSGLWRDPRCLGDFDHC